MELLIAMFRPKWQERERLRWNLKFLRPQSDVKIPALGGEMPFSFYYITENIPKVTSIAMKLRVMELYIQFYVLESGIKISLWRQSNLNISGFTPMRSFILASQTIKDTLLLLGTHNSPFRVFIQ